MSLNINIHRSVPRMSNDKTKPIGKDTLIIIQVFFLQIKFKQYIVTIALLVCGTLFRFHVSKSN